MLQDWQVALLVLTNLILWIAIVYDVWKAHFTEATVIFLLFLASTLYHMCQGGWWCASSLWEGQATDHVFVYATIAWIFLTFWVLTPDIRFSLFLVIIFLTILFISEATDSFVFLAFFIWFFVLFALFRVVGVGEPIRRYDIALIVVAGLLVGAGFALHLVGDSADSSQYWWAHSLWHVFAMLGIFVVILIRDGAYIFKAWGIDDSILWHPRDGGTKRKHKTSTKSPPTLSQSRTVPMAASSRRTGRGISRGYTSNNRAAAAAVYDMV